MAAACSIIALRNRWLRAEVLPELGGSLARLDWLGAAAPQPLLRPYDVARLGEGERPRPGLLACFPLVPWSNRMAGGFSHGGQQFRIPPNREDDPYPMHGHGWQRPWCVAGQSDQHVLLSLAVRDGHPFSYDASLEYALRDRALAVTLTVANAGAAALPFGLGLHPWMPRRDGVTLAAPAHQVWLAGPDKLPLEAAPIPPEWNFSQARALPVTLIDHIFEGWSGHAEIRWPDGPTLTLDSDVRYLIVYAPPGKDFFCVEPVDHMINAHNLPGGPERHGLTILAPGQRLSRTCVFSVAG